MFLETRDDVEVSAEMFLALCLPLWALWSSGVIHSEAQLGVALPVGPGRAQGSCGAADAVGGRTESWVSMGPPSPNNSGAQKNSKGI